jgi:hypothetical protein
VLSVLGAVSNRAMTALVDRTRRVDGVVVG